MQAAQSAVRSSQRDRGERGDWTDFAHTAPGTLAGRYMRRFWHPVYRSEDLPTGCAMPLKIMGEDYSLYRGEDGAAHALAFRCAHRGTQLSTGWVEGHNLRCFYHGWVYGPDGQCVEQPAEPEPFCGRIKIRSYPVEEYLGLIFAYQGVGEPPPFQRYPDLEQSGTLKVTTYVRPCNFFNNVENGLDPAHVPFTHGSGHDFGPADVWSMRVVESEFGITTYRDRAHGPVQVNEFGMPNVLLRIGARRDQDALAWRVPVDDENHVSFNVDHIRRPGDSGPAQVEPDAAPRQRDMVSELSGRVLAGELSMDDVSHNASLINIQDTVTQAGQGVIADRSSEHLGRSDVAIVMIRELWLRELRALAEGRELKHWWRSQPAARS